MIFFEEKKIAFLFPAKTGSSTAVHFLKKSKLKYTEVLNKHVSLKGAKNEFPQIKDYVIYCFFRNPVERAASYIIFDENNIYSKNILKIFKSGIKDKDYTNFLDVYFKNKINNFTLAHNFLPQWTHYLNGPNVEVLDFIKYEPELRRASQSLDLDNVEIKKENESKYEDFGVDKSEFVSWLTPYMKDYFADDCKFMYEKFGRRIDA